MPRNDGIFRKKGGLMLGIRRSLNEGRGVLLRKSTAEPRNPPPFDQKPTLNPKP